MLVAGALLALYDFPYAPHSWCAHALDHYLRGYASAAGGVLHWFDPTVRVSGRQIDGRFSLSIVKACDAMDVQILLVSAVSAWPTTAPQRIVAAFVGCLAIFILNVARICSLYYVGLLRPESFELVHVEVWPALILIVVAAGFLGWARKALPVSGQLA